MKQRKIPMRTCLVTNEKLEKKDLLRIVRSPSGEILVDLTGKMNGRGAYIKKDKSIVELAKKKKVLDKKLEKEVPSEVYDEILKILEK